MTQGVAWDAFAWSEASFAAALRRAQEAAEDSGAAYLVVVTFCSFQQLSGFQRVAEKESSAAADVFIWYKPDGANTAGNRLTSSAENGFVTYFNFTSPGKRVGEQFNFRKGERRHNVFVFPQDVNISREYGVQANPAQKPLALASFLVQHFSKKGIR